MSLDYRVIPLPALWPGKVTPTYQRVRPQFKTIWTKALRLLEREVGMLRGRNVTIAVDVTETHLRQDGQLRADARPRSSSVIVSFDVKDGRLQFPCDNFTNWQENVDAIARALEALRLVDRYGVQQGRQYSGFKEIPSATQATLSVEAAAAIIAEASGHMSANGAMLKSIDIARTGIRLAFAKTHPDAGGTAARFQRVQQAKAVLEAHHGGRL